MSRECPSVRELAELLDVDLADPRCAHVRDCVRCRNLLARLREFQTPAAALPPAEVAAAERQMAQALERAQRRVVVTPRSAWWRRSWWYPALSAAVFAAVIFTAYQFIGPSAPGGPGTLRGKPNSAEILAPEAPQLLADGGLRFAWQRSPEGESYAIVFFDLHLNELARFAPTGETTFALAPADVAGLGASGEQVLWQIVALRRGVEIAQSRPAPLILP